MSWFVTFRLPFSRILPPTGTDTQRILVLHCNRTDGSDGSLLAVDTHARIRFASYEVALLLGYPMRKLVGMRLEQLLPPPFNMLHVKWLRVSADWGESMQDRGASECLVVKYETMKAICPPTTCTGQHLLHAHAHLPSLLRLMRIPGLGPDRTLLM